jgi:uncharacterized membrane protein YhaH (DUF805 family)
MLFFGIILNICIITISVDFGSGTPIVTSLMLLATIYLLLWDWPKLRLILLREKDIKVDLSANELPFMESNWWGILGLILFLFTLVFVSFSGRKDILLWFISCVMIGLIGLIVFLVLERRKKTRLSHVG